MKTEKAEKVESRRLEAEKVQTEEMSLVTISCIRKRKSF